MTGGSTDDPVAAFYRAYNSRSAADAASLYAEDGWHQEGAEGRRRAGREALRTGLDRFFAMLPDASWAVRERIDAGASVAVVYTMTGRLGLDLGGRPTKGLAIELPGIHVFEIQDGVIQGTRDYWDPACFGRQIEGRAE